jgi:hypothetical protein
MQTYVNPAVVVQLLHGLLWHGALARMWVLGLRLLTGNWVSRSWCYAFCCAGLLTGLVFRAWAVGQAYHWVWPATSWFVCRRLYSEVCRVWCAAAVF